MSRDGKRAALYARVSTAEQAKKQTIETQVGAIRAYCQAQGLIVVTEYLDDGISGSRPIAERPSGSQLMTDAPTGLFDAVVVHRLDRLGRSMADYTSTISKLTKMGLRVVSVTEHLDDTPEGRFIGNIHGSVAEWEAERIRDRTHGGKVRKARQGKWPGGIPPYGYRVNKDKELEVDPDYARVVAEAFRLYVEEGMSTYDVAEYMDAMGAPLSHHKDEYKRKRGVWRAIRVSRMLCNPLYTGRGTLTMTVDGQPTEIRLEVPPIIDEATFRKCERLRVKNRKLSKRNSKRLYLLRGLVTCGVCGAAYVGDAVNRGRNPYYRCLGNRVRRPLKGEQCVSKVVPAQWLEDEVWRQVEALVRDPGDIILDLQKRLKESTNDEAVEKELAAIDTRLAEMESGRRVVINLARQQVITEEEAAEELHMAKKEADLLKDRRGQLEQAKANRQRLQDELYSTTRLLEELRSRVDEATPETKRMLIERLVEGVTVNTVQVIGDATVVVTVKYRFSENLGAEASTSVYGERSCTTATLVGH